MKLVAGAPAIPEAQLVYSKEKDTWGVAVRDTQFVCQLPKQYAGPGLELAMTDNGLIAIHPDWPPLVIDPSTGNVRPL
jgi:hypothetical protein